MLKTIQGILTTTTKFILIISALLILSACSGKLGIISPQKDIEETSPAPQFEPVFTKSEIPDGVREKMDGVTISDTSIMTYENLSYLTLTYYGYDDFSHTGNLIVDKALADEVIQIFKELYEVKFPIEKMRLPCEYGGVDELSMRDNNTSAFCDRPIEDSTSISNHQLGRAIDINPLINPYIRFRDGKVLPETAHKYLNRTLNEKGMIQPDGVCVKIFKKHGWEWGGDWTSLKDYQHFEKKKN